MYIGCGVVHIHVAFLAYFCTAGNTGEFNRRPNFHAMHRDISLLLFRSYNTNSQMHFFCSYMCRWKLSNVRQVVTKFMGLCLSFRLSICVCLLPLIFISAPPPLHLVKRRTPGSQCDRKQVIFNDSKETRVITYYFNPKQVVLRAHLSSLACFKIIQLDLCLLSYTCTTTPVFHPSFNKNNNRGRSFPQKFYLIKWAQHFLRSSN